MISDIHLHEWAYGGASLWTSLNARLEDQNRALKNVLTYCEQWDVKTIFMCGDLFHTNNRINGTALWVASSFYKKAASLGIKIWSIFGNHDVCDTNFNSLNWISEPHVLPNSYSSYELFDRPFHFINYQKDMTDLKSFFATMSEGTVVILHDGVQGAQLGNGYVLGTEKVKQEDVPKGVQIIAGHYHQPQSFPNVLIPGALNQHNWGDAGQKRGFWHWKEDTFSFQESKVARFKKIDMGNTSAIDEDAFTSMLSGLVEQDIFLRIENWSGDKEELTEFINTSPWSFTGGSIRSIEYGVDTIEQERVKFTSVGGLDQEETIKSWIADYPGDKRGTSIYEGAYESPKF